MRIEVVHFLGSPMVVARAAALAFLVLFGACNETTKGFSAYEGGADGAQGGYDGPPCSFGCVTAAFASFDLSCGPTDLTSVLLSGPCATGDASPSNYVDMHDTTLLSVGSPSPGVCHVELTFATGFDYSADVTFVSETDNGSPGCPLCPPFIAPTQGTFEVNNPSTTCQDAGSDAEADG
jgi:hypothetical protein